MSLLLTVLHLTLNVCVALYSVMSNVSAHNVSVNIND